MDAKKNNGIKPLGKPNTDVTALYTRVSTDAQSEEGYSLDAQKEKLIQLCRLKCYETYEIYEDGGWSGSNLDRPEMKRMISDIINGRVVRVVVYKLDRLSRSQRDTLYLLEDVFIPNNVEFISINENFDTSTPYGKASLGIMSVFAQLERENIRMRTRLGMYARVKEGLWMGGGRVPFGYDYDKKLNTLIPNEHAGEVKEIYDLYLKGYSTTQLAKMYPVCSDNQIASILDRVTYTGKISYNGEIIQGIHEPIIDEDTWLKVKAERARRTTRGITKSRYLFAGLIECGKCHAHMRYQKWSGNKIRISCQSQYKSSQQYMIKDPNCDNVPCFAHELEPVVLADLFDMTDTITVDLSSKAGDIKTGRDNAIKTLQSRYDAIAAKIKRLYNLYAESENELLLDTIKENQQELLSIGNILNDEKESAAAVQNVIERASEVANLRGRWDAMTLDEKRNSVLACIEKIIVTDGAIDIKYRI